MRSDCKVLVVALVGGAGGSGGIFLSGGLIQDNSASSHSQENAIAIYTENL